MNTQIAASTISAVSVSPFQIRYDTVSSWRTYLLAVMTDNYNVFYHHLSVFDVSFWSIFLFYHYTSNLKEITVQDMNEVNEYRKEVILASLLRLL